MLSTFIPMTLNSKHMQNNIRHSQPDWESRHNTAMTLNISVRTNRLLDPRLRGNDAKKPFLNGVN
jgi:hypothetical protein